MKFDASMMQFNKGVVKGRHKDKTSTFSDSLITQDCFGGRELKILKTGGLRPDSYRWSKQKI